MNQSKRKTQWSVSGNHKPIINLPLAILYKSDKNKTPLAVEITGRTEKTLALQIHCIHSYLRHNDCSTAEY